MQTHTIVLIVLAVIIAWIVALFQYVYSAKKRSGKLLFFAFLRFLGIFVLLLLLINPTFKKHSYFIEKPTLVVAVDNSTSIKYLEQDEAISNFVTLISANEELNDKFDIAYYSFSDKLKDSLILTFDQGQTNISKAIEDLDQIYKNAIAPTVLITDGNQTYGKDYHQRNRRSKQQIYPIISGDTAAILDTRIQQLNVNRYAYLKNKFPVEAILTYFGDMPVKTEFQVKSGQQIVYSESISFSEINNSKVVNFTLPANRVGVNTYTGLLVPLKDEKNMVNNRKDFAVEVIDQKTSVLIVSDVIHPDLGALKKSIESNERRSATIQRPSEVNTIEDYQLIILYQPNRRFKSLYDKLSTERKNQFTITGSKTDWTFLNNIQKKYKQEITSQKEYYIPEFNTNYGTFLLDDIGFNEYPPLIGVFGDITIKTAYDPLLYRSIGDIVTDSPLLATIEEEGIREAVLFGEGIWRWRAQHYIDSQSFEGFDEFMGKLIQYLASSKRKSRLNTISESFYYGNSNIIIKAEFFTKNYEFDRRGNLKIILENKQTAVKNTIPMLLKNNSYEVDLSSFSSGDYKYTVVVANENISHSGSFTILDYNVEQQFLNADATKLEQLAINTNGKSYYLDQQKTFINDLINDQRYQSVQKSKEKVISLIDWKYLLGVLLFVLATEWFLRKYNGLI